MREIFYAIYDPEDEAQLKMYTDQTGRFPKKSSQGNQYIMVLIELDSNAILVEAMKTTRNCNKLPESSRCAPVNLYF